jgi:hypothetical protein
VVAPEPVDEPENPPPSNPGDSEPQPAPTADWKRYLTPACAAALDEVGRLRDDLTGSPSNLFDADWREQFSQATSALSAACGTLETASPVPGLIDEARADLAQASREYNQASELINQGFRDFSPRIIWRGLQHLGSATSAFNQALGTLRKIGQ